MTVLTFEILDFNLPNHIINHKTTIFNKLIKQINNNEHVNISFLKNLYLTHNFSNDMKGGKNKYKIYINNKTKFAYINYNNKKSYFYKNDKIYIKIDNNIVYLTKKSVSYDKKLNSYFLKI